MRIYSVCAVSVLYYLGLMQWLLRKLSWIMEFTLKASAAETVVVMGKQNKTFLFMWYASNKTI